MIGHNFQLFVYIFKKCVFLNFLVVAKMHYFHEKNFFREKLIFHGKNTNYYV